MPSAAIKDASGATITVQTLPAVGVAASGAALPVVIASDQANVPVTLAPLGATGDAAWDGAAASASLIAAVKALWNKLGTVLKVDTVVPAATVDRSGTITAGGTAQTLMAANPSRRGMWVQNLSASDLWTNGVGAATAGQPSLRIPAGALYETPPHHAGTGAISIFGATTGQAFSAREF